MTTLQLFLLAGLFLPLYPLSIGANLLLQRRPEADGPGASWYPVLKTVAMVLMPLIGVGLMHLGLARLGADERGLVPIFALWGGLSSVLYAFRLLSVREGRIWIGQIYSSALALVWVGLGHDVAPLLPALGLGVSLLPLLFLMGELRQRFGTARVGLYPGLAVRMPRFSVLFTIAVLVAAAVPFSPAFFAIAKLALGGAASNGLMALVPVSLSWLLWTWAGVNLLTGIVFGAPREDLAYTDLSWRNVLRHASLLFVLAVFGIFLVEGVVL